MMLKLVATYGICGFLRLCFHLVVTWIFNRPARLIRRPFYIRGRSKIVWGNGFTTGVGVRLDAFGSASQPCLIIGNNVQLNDYVHVAAIESVEIGDDTLIASRVFISDHNHGCYNGQDIFSSPDVPPVNRPIASSPVMIGKKVWVGENVCILPGVTIGDGAIIGAGAVVTKSIPAGCIAVGNPARVVRRFDVETAIWVLI